MQTSVRAPLQQELKHQTESIQRKTVGVEPKQFHFEDRRPVAVTQRKLSELVNWSPRVVQQEAVARSIGDSAFVVQQKEDLLRVAPVQLTRQPVAKPNKTGMPDRLKSGIEAMSGMSMDHVRVHYNSDKPAQLQAHAYAQGSEIHIGPGQDKHLPHEAWHVVQQAQGRVRPTFQMKSGVVVNDDVGLEREADVMGGRASGVSAVQMHKDVGMLELTPSLRMLELTPSLQPAQLDAHAYAQGSDIHLGSGQGKHLPHEAWHVVQQAQGRVKPTLQMKTGVSVNDDTGLENEADLMRARALGAGAVQMRKGSDVGMLELTPAPSTPAPFNNSSQVLQKKELADMINNNLCVLQQKAQMGTTGNRPRMLVQRQKIDALFGGLVQRQENKLHNNSLAFGKWDVVQMVSKKNGRTHKHHKSKNKKASVKIIINISSLKIQGRYLGHASVANKLALIDVINFRHAAGIKLSLPEKTAHTNNIANTNKSKPITGLKNYDLTMIRGTAICHKISDKSIRDNINKFLLSEAVRKKCGPLISYLKSLLAYIHPDHIRDQTPPFGDYDKEAQVKISQAKSALSDLLDLNKSPCGSADRSKNAHIFGKNIANSPVNLFLGDSVTNSSIQANFDQNSYLDGTDNPPSTPRSDRATVVNELIDKKYVALDISNSLLGLKRTKKSSLPGVA